MPTSTDRALRVHVTGDPARPDLDLATGLLAPRVLGRDESGVRVALVSTGATLLGGDVVEVDLSVGPGLALHVVDTSATVAYHGRGRPARIRTRLHVGASARLTWDAHPLVLASGAEVGRELVADVADGGTLLLRDTLVLGRAGEEGGSLRCETVAAYDGRPALVETLELDADRCAPGLIGPHRVVDNALAIGERPDVSTGSTDGGDESTVFELAEPGRLVRWLGVEAHASPVAAVWDTWQASSTRQRAGMRFLPD